LKLHDLPADPHTPTPDEQAEQNEQRQQEQILQIARAQATWGPASSAPGMSIALKEVGRTKTAAGTELTYQITGSGFTPEMKLTLLRWPLNQNVLRVMDGIIVDSTGTAVCEGKTGALPAGAAVKADSIGCMKTMKPNQPIEIKAMAAKGEAVRVALVASDQKHGAAVSYAPFPLEGDSKGCQLQVLLGSKDAELVLIEGSGFKPGVSFTMGSESYGQKRTVDVKITDNGKFAAAMTPWVAGHDTGDTVVFYQSDACTPTLSFHWGKNSYKAE
jgi:hypothetical protein